MLLYITKGNAWPCLSQVAVSLHQGYPELPLSPPCSGLQSSGENGCNLISYVAQQTSCPLLENYYQTIFISGSALWNGVPFEPAPASLWGRP